MSLAVLLSVATQVIAAKQLSGATAPHREAGPLCGIYCVYTAARIEGLPVELKTLVRPEYVGDFKGSSFTDLVKAASSVGLNTFPLYNMSATDLESISCPVIAHVKSGELADTYNHFVLIVDVKGGVARIVDPSANKTSVPLMDVVSAWDGSGLAISKDPIEPKALQANMDRHFLIIAGAAILLFCCSKLKFFSLLGTAKPGWFGRFGVQASLIIAITVLLSGADVLTAEDSLLRNGHAVRRIQDNYAAAFLPALTLEQMRSALNDGTLIIDARFAEDYEAGHIKGAISLPVNASEALQHKIFDRVANDRKIVVYCQSSGCIFSRRVARQLMDNGYHNLQLYPGGWNEWESRRDRSQ
jgi:rhodanese-related sulfurtransferase/predicted double-glycine peptidase